ncbi:hypothetical protein ACLGIH_20505 [Streptomyces sp. HMX87]|uniref:hypothetical protein n=1 Tax=Streptomyces sp. HMX87 TaxID=3390849 RepID=UPI003A87E6C0
MPTQTQPEHRIDIMRGVGPTELSRYTGHYFQVLRGTEGYAGLLVRVDGRYAEIFQPRLRGTERFKIGNCTFIRSLDKAPRPAYARALAHQRQWEAIDLSLRRGVEDAQITDQAIWDRRRGEWEHGLVAIHEALMQEMYEIPVCDLHPVYDGE